MWKFNIQTNPMSTRNKFEHGSEGKKNTWNTSLSSMADTNTSTPTSSKSTRRQRSTPTKASTTSLTTPPKPLSSYSVISFERLNESIELMTVLSEGFLKDIGQDTPDDSCSEAEKAPGVVSRIFRSGLQNGSREKVNRRTRNGTQTTDESTIRTVDKSWRPPRPPPPTAEALQRGKDDTSTSKATQNAKAISYTKHPPSRRVLSLPSGLSWSGYTNQLTSVTSNPSADLIKKSEVYLQAQAGDITDSLKSTEVMAILNFIYTAHFFVCVQSDDMDTLHVA